nr:hypothetical protein [Legionella sp. km772]
MDSNCLLYAPPIKGLVIREKSLMQLSLPVRTKISFLGMPRAKLSSQGLKWELTNTHLDFPGRTSCFNRVQQSPITIEVDQGAVLLLVYEQKIDDAGS